MTNTSNYALRLQTSLLNALKKLSRAEGASVNQMINVAVAEKLAVLGIYDHFKQRAKRGSPIRGWEILQKAGKGNSPLPGDELPSTKRKKRK